MAFKMKYSNGGFPYQSPLKDDTEFTATSSQSSISKEDIGFSGDPDVRDKEDLEFFKKNKYAYKGPSGRTKSEITGVKPTMGTAGPIDAGKKLWSIGKSLFTG